MQQPRNARFAPLTFNIPSFFRWLTEPIEKHFVIPKYTTMKGGSQEGKTDGGQTKSDHALDAPKPRRSSGRQNFARLPNPSAEGKKSNGLPCLVFGLLHSNFAPKVSRPAVGWLVTYRGGWTLALLSGIRRSSPCTSGCWHRPCTDPTAQICFPLLVQSCKCWRLHPMRTSVPCNSSPRPSPDLSRRLTRSRPLIPS